MRLRVACCIRYEGAGADTSDSRGQAGHANSKQTHEEPVCVAACCAGHANLRVQVLSGLVACSLTCVVWSVGHGTGKKTYFLCGAFFFGGSLRVLHFACWHAINDHPDNKPFVSDHTFKMDMPISSVHTPLNRSDILGEPPYWGDLTNTKNAIMDQTF